MQKQFITDKIQQEVRMLTFFLNNDLYSVSVSDIREVNRLTKHRPVEKAPDWVLGVINFHGKTTLVFNLKKLLSIEPYNLDQKALWLAVENNGINFCLAVDRIGKFLNISSEIVDEMPARKNEYEFGSIKYYIRINDSLIPVLDVKGILALSEKYIDTPY